LALFLVDTHVVLWHVLDDPRLGPAPTSLIEAEDAEVLVSVVSLWEIAIKRALGKLRAPDDLPARLPGLGFGLLGIEVEHVWAVGEMPHHHGDPFDRLLIAQARAERLPILTADPAFADYDVSVIWDRT
jgi:PIN domain nuclease of toxin-antitoxin system